MRLASILRPRAARDARWPPLACTLLVALLALSLASCGAATAIQSCGAIQTGQPAVDTSPAATHAVTNCLAQAYAHCSAASLVEARSFGDGWTKTTLAVTPGQNDGCGVAVQWATTLAGSGAKMSGQSACAAMTQRDDAWGTLDLTGCGPSGDITVPYTPGA